MKVQTYTTQPHVYGYARLNAVVSNQSSDEIGIEKADQQDDADADVAPPKARTSIIILLDGCIHDGCDCDEALRTSVTDHGEGENRNYHRAFVFSSIYRVCQNVLDSFGGIT